MTFTEVKFSKKAASPTSSIKAPATNFNTFNAKWKVRHDTLTQIKGMSWKDHIKPVWQNDLSRVKQGKQPYTDAEVLDFVMGLQHGQSLIHKIDSGHHGPFGIVGNAVSDIGKVAHGINPVNLVPALYKGGLGLDAFAARVLGDTLATHKYKPGETTPVTGFLNQLQSWVPGYKGQAKEVAKQVEAANKTGGIKGVVQGLRQIPGVNIVPGTYTTANILSGHPEEAYKHPIFTGLDVLPYAGKVGEAAAGLKYGEAAAKGAARGDIIPKGSPWEALADGKPLKAATRAARLTGEGSPITKLAQRAGVSKDIREAAGMQAQGAVDPRFVALQETRLTAAKNAYGQLKVFEGAVADTANTASHPSVVAAQAALDQAKAELAPGVKTSMNVGKAEKALQVAKDEAGAAHLDAKIRRDIAESSFNKAVKDAERVAPANFIARLWEMATPKSDLATQLGKQGMTGEGIESYIDSNYTDLYQWSGRWSVDERMKDFITGGVGRHDLLRDQMVPKYLTDAMDKLNRPPRGDIFTKSFQTTTNIFKYAVLMGPRHLIHVLASNGMFMSLDNMGVYSQIANAFRMVEGDEKAWPARLQRGVATYGQDMKAEVRNFSTEDLHSIGQGKTFGRMLRDWASQTHPLNPINILNPLAYRRFEEFVTDMSRAMEYLYGKEKFLKSDEGIKLAKQNLAPGVKNSMELGKAMKAAEPLAHEAGLQQALKVLMDIDHMSPIERTVFRQVFPFYPFTRQLMRYMIMFPAEHPMKAAVVAALGRMELADAATGLPMQFMNLFPITGANKNGDAIYVDTKNLNPFRSMNGLSPFTLAGFLSEMNPLITSPFQAAGVNILSGSSELFPNLTVDENYGTLTAKPKYGLAQITAENIVPEFKNVEAMMGWSSKLTELKKNDPEAYRKALLSNLNLPFSPGPRNLNKERIQFSANQYTVAKQDVTNAIKSGNLDSLPYKYIPYQGKIWTKSALKKALGQ